MLGPIDVADIEILSPLPQSVVRLAQVVTDPESTIQEFCQIISFDAPLTANVLKWANSAWSQAQHAIATIDQAVIRLGSQNILKLSIGYHLMGPMNKACPAYNLSENELWRHSVRAALAVEMLEPLSTCKLPPAAYAAALIHDIGKIILGRKLGQEALDDMIRTTMDEQHCNYVEAEKQAIGTDHAEVGAAVAAAWNLPNVIVEAIRFHHNGHQSDELIVDIVQLANLIAQSDGESFQAEIVNTSLAPAMLQRFGLSEVKLIDICQQVQLEQKNREQCWAASGNPSNHS